MFAFALTLFDEAQPDALSAARALVPLFLESAPWLLAVLLALIAWTAWGVVRAGPRAWFATTLGGSPQET